ncbi:MAG: hypothetical protein H0T76_16020, partial [Nannocystis sp.]
MSSRPARWFARSLVCTLGVAALACTSKGAPKPEVVAEPVQVPEPEPPTPVPVVAEPEPPAPKTRHQQRPATIAAAEEHACALEGAGTVACWGRGDDGQLAPGTDKHSATPVRVPGIDDAVALGVLRRVSCALRAGGALTCWGTLGSKVPQKTASSRALGEVAEFAMIEGTEPGVCARRVDGTIACALLVGLIQDTAQVIEGIDDAVAIDVGGISVHVLRATGVVDSFAPFEAKAPGGAIALTREESLGEVIDIGRVQLLICAALATGEVRCRGYGKDWHRQTPTAGPLWKSRVPGELSATTVDATDSLRLHCLRDDGGKVSCWGPNEFGQRGTGTTGHSLVPRQVFAGPTEALDAGGDRTCVVRPTGETDCFV